MERTLYLSEFLIEFIEHVSDSDLDMLLDFVYSKPDRFNPKNDENYSIKAEFMFYLLSRERAKILFYHLHGIYYCYSSYKSRCFTDKEHIKNFRKLYKEEFKDDIGEIPYLTSNDITKLFGYIIHSFKENGFYYYFTDNNLVKFELLGNLSKRFGKNLYEINEVSYDFIYTNCLTYVNNDKENLFRNLGVKIIQNDETFDFEYIEDIEKFKKEFKKTTEALDLKKIETLHKKLINVIKNKRDDSCVWCFPERNNKRAKKLCDNCKNLKEEFAFLKQFIKRYAESKTFIVNDYIYDFYNKFNLDKTIKDIEFNGQSEINDIRNKRGKALSRVVNKIQHEAEKELKGFKDKDAIYQNFYEEVLETVLRIKKLICTSFGSKYQ